MACVNEYGKVGYVMMMMNTCNMCLLPAEKSELSSKHPSPLFINSSSNSSSSSSSNSSSSRSSSSRSSR